MTVDYQKVWNTMNDLEQVISKVCSAREMIEVANDAIVNHDYSRAETMTMAAYEFLGYFIEEFDEKFKDAWKATVGDLRDGDVAKQFDYTATGEKFAQYTEEELNAMCDAAAEQEERDKCREYNLREAEYYDKRAKLDADYEKSKKKWTLSVQQSNVDGVDDYYIEFPDDLLKAANLKEGDTVEWIDRGDGSFEIKKIVKEKTYDEMIADGWTMTADGFWIKESDNHHLFVK